LFACLRNVSSNAAETPEIEQSLVTTEVPVNLRRHDGLFLNL